MVPLSLLLRYIEEDAPAGDITSEVLVSGRESSAVIIARQKGIIGGLDESGALFSHYGVEVQSMVQDGSPVDANQKVMELRGDAEAILLVERTALNIIGRMSGIATRTRTLVELAKRINPKVRVAATRKTCPGMRLLDKRAVLLGGGDPHRCSLSDMILIKDNHLSLVSLEEAIKKTRAVSLYKKIEVEVASIEEAVQAATLGADIVMLDNMPPEEAEKTIQELKRLGLRDRVAIEISGGIDESNFPVYARLDVDVISMGCLTHSVENFNASLEVVPGAKSFRL